MRYVLTILFCLLSQTSFAQIDSVDIWISRINNDQLRGTCHYYWMIEIVQQATEGYKLLNSARPVGDRLIENLTDKKKGVICHYILSMRPDTFSMEMLERKNGAIKYSVNGFEFWEKNGTTEASDDELGRMKAYWDHKRRNGLLNH